MRSKFIPTCLHSLVRSLGQADQILCHHTSGWDTSALSWKNWNAQSTDTAIEQRRSIEKQGASGVCAEQKPFASKKEKALRKQLQSPQLTRSLRRRRPGTAREVRRNSSRRGIRSSHPPRARAAARTRPDSALGRQRLRPRVLRISRRRRGAPRSGYKTPASRSRSHEPALSVATLHQARRPLHPTVSLMSLLQFSTSHLRFPTA
mmetsp:Transcript_156666/g.300494  ORF Transcript_156666/g.300494 Transcript_156666/m.300494 type:complete len:205 (+) Transcript_156666:2898-3512(+)